MGVARVSTIIFVVFVSFLASRTGIAQDASNRAGLVVRGQHGELIYAVVAFPEDEISSLELLERSPIPIVTVGFGGLGEAVCAIADDGCSVTECQRRLCQGPGPDAPFWQSFRQRAPGDWRWQMLGASAATVRDGDIDGWSWTSGEANLPAVTLAEIAERAANQAVAPASAGTAGIDWQSYAGAGGILLAIGAASVLLSRRRAGPGGAR